MMMRINYSGIKFICLLFMVMLSCSCSHKQATQPQPAVIAAGGGFGYTISIHNKVIIKQETIPAVAGDVVFCDSIDAVKVSRLVAQKLSKKQSPAITKQDLAQLKIKTKC